MPQSPPQKPEDDSRGRRKADMLALQKIGESLVKLTEEQLGRIALPDNLLEAVLHAKSLHSNEAKRRQMQYIGKIMREIDPAEIKQALKNMQLIHEKNTDQFHLIENWREKLIVRGDEAVTEFLVDYQAADRQQLRQLVRKAQQDRKNDKAAGGEKALFKFIREIIEKK